MIEKQSQYASPNSAKARSIHPGLLTPLRIMLSREVHVWVVHINLVRIGTVADVSSVMSDAEVQRASRIRSSVARHRFMVSREALRHLLGAYMGAPPAAVAIHVGRHGKPELACQRHTPKLRFNLSHSDALAVVALALCREVGVDVERIVAEQAPRRLVTRALSTSELVRLRRLPVSARPRAFFQAWTAKEAYLKALGTGLSRPLGEVELRAATSEPSCLAEAGGATSGTAGWGLRALPLPSGYVGSVVAEGHDWHVRMRRWDSADGAA